MQVSGFRSPSLVLAVAACGLVIAFPSAARGDPLDSFVAAEMEARKLPGLSYAVVKGGRIVDQRAYGFANLETQFPASADTVFAVGSITKSFTAIVLMMLVEDRIVALDDEIGVHVAGLPKRWRKLTLRQLASNTSGVSDDLGNPCLHEGPRQTPGAPAYSVHDLFAEVSCLPLLHSPGEAFHYSDFNFTMLGLLVEAKTGLAYGDALAARLFTPLGMSNTRLLDYSALIASRADGYEWRGDGYINVEPMDPALEFASGAALSTTTDMAKFLAALGGPLMSRDSWKMLWSKPASVTGSTPYGLGFGLTPFQGVRRVGHNGSAVGFASSLSWFPDQDTGVIVLSNGYQEPFGRNVQDLTNEIALRTGALALQ